MFFNPLFLRNLGGSEGAMPMNTGKPSGKGYLFSDIINVHLNSEEGKAMLGSSASDEKEGASSLVKSILPELNKFILNALNHNGKDVPSKGNGIQQISEGSITEAELDVLIASLMSLKLQNTDKKAGENSESNGNSENKQILLDASNIKELEKLFKEGQPLVISLDNKLQSLNIEVEPANKESSGKELSGFVGKAGTAEAKTFNIKMSLTDLANGNGSLNKKPAEMMLSFTSAKVSNSNNLGSNLNAVSQSSFTINLKESDIEKLNEAQIKLFGSKTDAAKGSEVLKASSPSQKSVNNHNLSLKQSGKTVIQNKIPDTASIDENKIATGLKETGTKNIVSENGKSNVVNSDVKQQPVSETEKVNIKAENLKAENSIKTKASDSSGLVSASEKVQNKTFSQAVDESLAKKSEKPAKGVSDSVKESSLSNTSKETKSKTSIKQEVEIKNNSVKSSSQSNAVDGKSELKTNSKSSDEVKAAKSNEENTSVFAKKVSNDSKNSVIENSKVNSELTKESSKTKLSSNTETTSIDGKQKASSSKFADLEKLNKQNNSVVSEKAKFSEENVKIDDKAETKISLQNNSEAGKKSDLDEKLNRHSVDLKTNNTKSDQNKINLESNTDGKIDKIVENLKKSQVNGLSNQKEASTQQSTVNVTLNKAIKKVKISNEKPEAEKEAKSLAGSASVNSSSEEKVSLSEKFANMNQQNNQNSNEEGSKREFTETKEGSVKFANEMKQSQKVEIPTNENAKSSRIVKATEIVKELSKFMQKSDKGSLVLNIEPEHLGKLKISLETIDNSVKANIEVESNAVKHIVEANIKQLHTSLNQSGIQLGGINISLANSNDKNAKYFADKKKGSNSSSTEESNEANEVEEIERTKNLGYNTVEYVA